MRKDIIVSKNGAHVMTLCEANGTIGSITGHQHQHVIMQWLECTDPSLAIFSGDLTQWALSLNFYTNISLKRKPGTSQEATSGSATVAFSGQLLAKTLPVKWSAQMPEFRQRIQMPFQILPIVLSRIRLRWQAHGMMPAGTSLKFSANCDVEPAD